MIRRKFIALLGGAAAAWPLTARAQQRRCGGSVFSRVAAARTIRGQAPHRGVPAGLQRLGWTEGGNIRIEYRWSAAISIPFASLASELVALGPDVIFTTVPRAYHRCCRRPTTCRSCSRSCRSGRFRLCRASPGRAVT